MATNTDTHVSRVILDTKEAKDKLNELQNKLKEVQKARDEAYAKGESTTALERQIKRLKAETKAYITSQEKVNQVLNNLSSASYKELQLVAKALNRELKSGAIKVKLPEVCSLECGMVLTKTGVPSPRYWAVSPHSLLL